MASILQIKCEDIQSIKDLHDKFGPWKDQTPGGAGDNKKVSCKQTGATYDELMDKYRRHYSRYPEKSIAQAMCKCCQNKLTPIQKLLAANEWDAFYNCMREQGFNKDGILPKLPL